MSNNTLLRLMIRRTQHLIKQVNEAMGVPFFFINGECGYFRFYYATDAKCETYKLAASGKIDIEAFSKLIQRLEALA